MSSPRDTDDERLRRAVRQEVAATRRSAQARMQSLSPEAARAATIRRREMWATLMRETQVELVAKAAEIDRMVRFSDRFDALLGRCKR
ncbi:MAG TPA: hypothetical protein VIU82_10305 [Bosea sp. (in: a-proteobacteria)]